MAPRESTQERRQAQARRQPEPRQQPELRQQPPLRQQPESRSAPERWDRSGVDRRGAAQPRVAVPRQGPPPRVDGDRDRYRTYDRRYEGRDRYRYDRGRTYYYNYNYYSRPYYYYYPYAFGYGPHGRGFFYFDLHYNSYVWHPRTIIRYDTYGTYGYPTGELRLQVRPRDAQVFIDGAYAGTVDDFDGVFQSLRLEEGTYQIEIVLPGYEPLVFDVRIFPGEKVTYRGELIPELP